MLHRMVLAARSTIDTGPGALNGAFGSVLACCMRSSVAEGLTGGLVVEDGWFLEVLEGGFDALCAYRDRAFEDDRLDDLQVLEVVPVLQREYETWAIAASKAGTAQPGLIRAVSDKLSGPFAVSQHVRRVLMRGVLAETPPLCVAA
ncbi:BLUF domain-containing protein [Maricaulis sp.]|uniref:BLUF domain-containing protein n=1 Tax=Maricaulis sp. TaxID=1486257 RepID=UPI002B267F18|nr:BLUF domain-containing protein [Maricaulis sp.]